MRSELAVQNVPGASCFGMNCRTVFNSLDRSIPAAIIPPHSGPTPALTALYESTLANARGEMTLAHLYTVAFEGMEAREVDVQVHIAPGIPAFSIVGLA